MVLLVECVGLASGDGEPGRFGCPIPLYGISNSTNSRSCGRQHFIFRVVSEEEEEKRMRMHRMEIRRALNSNFWSNKFPDLIGETKIEMQTFKFQLTLPWSFRGISTNDGVATQRYPPHDTYHPAQCPTLGLPNEPRPLSSY